MADQQKFNITIPRGYNAEKRQAIAQRVLEFIKDRTLSGKDINGKPFPGYTPSYAKQKGQTNVDLYLSGEMLDNLQILKIGFNYITIGFSGSDELMGKVEGNITGSYGQPDPNPKKARNFLGISEKDLNNILREFPLSDSEQLEGVRENVLSAQVENLSPAQRRLLNELAALGD